MHNFVFVLEQTLGHVAHGKNIERAVLDEPNIDATFIRIDYTPRRGWRKVRGLGNWSIQASWSARRALKRRLAAGAADSVFIHTQVAGLLAVEVMRRIPTILSLDATPANFDRVGRAYSHRVSHPAVEALKRAANRRAFNAAAGLVAWCEWAADSLRDDYGVPSEKIRVIPPGVDTSVFLPSDRDHSSPVRLLFVGGDLERKGGFDLLSAVRGLGRRVELDLVTGGDPPVPAGDAVVRVHRGLRPQSPELVRLYREADVFVLPARGDCLPQAIAEAMACGLPVVATPVGAITELVRDGETGILVPPGSPAELARALAAIVANPQKRLSMGRAALEVARRDHDMRRNNRSVLALMSEVARAHSFAMGAM